MWGAEAVNYRRWGGRNPGIDQARLDEVVFGCAN